MDQPERVISFEKVESVQLTVREARWVFAALFHYREVLIRDLSVPEPEPAFLEDLETRFFRLTPESDGS